ncbi:hypothetical protein [Nocardia sp. CA-145437]|uniref:hypothetical protein n=1 Tax=Nocardia sp. CA-145437 TaxID=3239980 RepID=UPI003D99808D
MACALSRAEEPNGKKSTQHWHQLPTNVVLDLGESDPAVVLAWQPDPETGVQAYLSLVEAAALAEALITTLEHCESFTSNDGQDSVPDWVRDSSPNGIPRYFGPDARPLEEF